LQEILATDAPTEQTKFPYYLNAFQGMFSLLLNQIQPTTLVDAKKKAKNMDINYEMSGKPDIMAPPRARPKLKEKAFSSTESLNEFLKLSEQMKQLHLVVTQAHTIEK